MCDLLKSVAFDDLERPLRANSAAENLLNSSVLNNDVYQI